MIQFYRIYTEFDSILQNLLLSLLGNDYVCDSIHWSVQTRKIILFYDLKLEIDKHELKK